MDPLLLKGLDQDLLKEIDSIVQSSSPITHYHIVGIRAALRLQ